MLIPADPVHAFVDYPDVPVPNAANGHPVLRFVFIAKAGNVNVIDFSSTHSSRSPAN